LATGADSSKPALFELEGLAAFVSDFGASSAAAFSFGE
jgi:hypothetical protein